MLLTVYNSRMDKYGNCYWAVQLTDKGTVIAQGTIAANNINTIDLRENLNWEYTYQELPIREFNRKTKGWQYFGCRWESIKTSLINSINKEEISK